MSLRQILFAFFFLNGCFGLFAQSRGDQIFDDSKVHEIRFEFNQANYWQQLISNYENNADPFDDKPYLMGTVIIDGEQVDSVGVRFKGFTSYPLQSDKKPIKIDFNEFVSGQRYDGLRKLNLNNGTGDPGMQRDVISYDLHNAIGVDASRTSFARVYFNDTYWGLYQVIEQVDKEFLQRNFDDDDGNLFKNKAWSQFEDFGSDINAYKQIYELKTNEEEDDWSGFINLMDVINNTSESEFPAAIEEVFNVDRFLKVLAVDVATNNWDSYLQHGRNWYLYEDLSTGLFHWIPWDYNFALGGGGFNDQDNDDCEMIPFFAPFILDGNKVQFYDFSFSSSPIEYSWDFGDGSTSQEAEPEHKYLTGGTFNVCLTITASPECFETRCIAVNVSDSHESCSIFDDSDFTHEDERGLAILFNFLPICCDIWSSVCEQEYQNITGSGDGGFTFRIDQRQNEGILINRILNVPEFFDRYLDFYCEFLGEDYTFEKYSDLIDRNKALIEDNIFEDPNFLFEYETFESDLGPDGLKKTLESKIDALNEELIDLNPSCNLTSTSDATSWQDFPYRIFPNPASDHIRVMRKSNNSNSLSVRVFSSARMLKFQASDFDVDNQFIDTINYGVGIYFVEILDSTGKRTMLKFIKG